jgi:hypothetical protein
MSSPPAPLPTAPIGSPCIAPGCSAASLVECVVCRSAVSLALKWQRSAAAQAAQGDENADAAVACLTAAA